MVSIQVTQGGALYFNTNYWSCYVNENERFFIGGMAPFSFLTIRDIPNAINFEDAIKTIKIFDIMIQGAGLLGVQPKFCDVSGLKKLISCIINDNGSCISPYIYSLFKHIVNKQQQIVLNLRTFKKHKFGYVKHFGVNDYGYLKFLRYFVDSQDPDINDFASFNYLPFIQIMPNLKSVIVYDKEGRKLVKSLLLNDIFVSKLICCICHLNSLSFSVFKFFQFAEPKDDIDSFILSNNKKFTSLGWSLSHSQFEYPRFGISSKHSLLIEKN